MTLYDGTGKGMSVDNTLMGLSFLTASSASLPVAFNPYFEASPSYGTDFGRFSHQLYKDNGNEMYLVARLGSDSSFRGINQVDQSLYADRFLFTGPGYYNGYAYVDSQWGIPASQPNGGQSYTDTYLGNQSASLSGSYATSGDGDMSIAFTERFFTQAGLPLRWENTINGARIGEANARFSDGTSATNAPRALFYGGWYNFMNYNDVYEWLPGSVACDLNSASTFGTQALKKGATAAAYVVAELYLSGHQRPQILFYYLTKGFTFAEAAALATPYIRWMNTNEGDPLYAPFSPSRIPVKDISAPVILNGYPKLSTDAKTGAATLAMVIDDSIEPEVVNAVSSTDPPRRMAAKLFLRVTRALCQSPCRGRRARPTIIGLR